MGKVEIIFDSDPSLKLEKISLLRKVVDLIWIPFLNALPSGFGINFFEKSSIDGQSVKKFATTFRAMEILYNFDNKLHFKKSINNPFKRIIDGIFTWVWQHVHNVKSVRNRLKIVARELKNAIRYFEEESSNHIHFLSLGAGSARAPYEALQMFAKDKINSLLSITLIDKNQDALDYSEYISRKYIMPSNVCFQRINCKISEFPKFCAQKLNIVEAVGLFDYFDDAKIIEKFKLIYDNLDEEGYFMVSNIMPNREIPFVEKIIQWRGMHYRNIDDFARLLTRAGFKEKGIKIFIEPQNIHMIAAARKFTYV